MRIGSGGVMLPHYSPLKVAENFGVLAGLYPGRIDLGIGRAAGTDPMTTHALQRDRSQPMPDDFPEQLAELLGYFERSFPADHPLARLAESLPGNPEAPEPWLLGSSTQSAVWAGELGLPYAFADFINPQRRRHRRRLPRELRRRRAAGGAAAGGRGAGDRRRDRGGGGAARDQLADGLRPAAPRPPDRGAAAGEGGALPRAARRGAGGRPAASRGG